MARTKREIEVERREGELLRAFLTELRHQREDAGVSLTRLARAAGLTPGFLSRLDAGSVRPSLRSCVALALALGGDARLRYEPGAGVPLRDRYQARMVEALLRIVHVRWKRFLEVPVLRPIRGVIDLVLHDPDAGDVIATEAHSLIQRLEQQQRWANLKADSLLTGSALPLLLPGEVPPRVSRLLLLRDTRSNRALVEQFSATMAAAYPADPTAALESVRGTAPWPGAALIWIRVHGSDAAIVVRGSNRRSGAR